MADYKKMYTALFNKVTDVIEELQQVQSDTEKLYMDSSEHEIVLLKPKDDMIDIIPEKKKRKKPSA